MMTVFRIMHAAISHKKLFHECIPLIQQKGLHNYMFLITEKKNSLPVPREGENDNRRRMAWNAHAHIYTINS